MQECVAGFRTSAAEDEVDLVEDRDSGRRTVLLSHRRQVAHGVRGAVAWRGSGSVCRYLAASRAFSRRRVAIPLGRSYSVLSTWLASALTGAGVRAWASASAPCSSSARMPGALG